MVPPEVDFASAGLLSFNDAAGAIEVVAKFPGLSLLVPARMADSMKDEIFQAASNTLKAVAVRRRKWNLPPLLIISQ
jgi:hypothetical protein